jgi:hypothetical protein
MLFEEVPLYLVVVNVGCVVNGGAGRVKQEKGERRRRIEEEILIPFCLVHCCKTLKSFRCQLVCLLIFLGLPKIVIARVRSTVQYKTVNNKEIQKKSMDPRAVGLEDCL